MSREVMAASALDFLLSDNGEFTGFHGSGRFLIGQFRWLKPWTIGPAIEILDNIRMARPPRERRLLLFGQFAR
jgi:hypothetical protein